MAAFHLVGIGNALVDTEYVVNDEKLQELGVEKGVMTLVDEETQNRLSESLKPYYEKRACGGSAANTIITAAQLGLRCHYISKVADDDDGRFYLDDLQAQGVYSSQSKADLPAGVTGRCSVMVSPDAERTMNTFLGITADLDPELIAGDVIDAGDILYIEGYLAGSDIAFETALLAQKQAKQAGKKVAFTLSDPNMVKFCGDRLMQIIKNGVDILFCNEHEAKELTQSINTSEALAQLGEWANVVAVTLGSKGALALVDGETYLVPGENITPIDTNGAGDNFAGGFIAGLALGLDWDKSVRLGNYVASRVCLQYGPRLNEAHVKDASLYLQLLSESK
jgi:sugar/nucleoside kinase (ribokinase family)